MTQLLAILADVANGVFAVVLAGYVTNTEVLWWHFLIGIPLAMSPDLDAIGEILERGKVGSSAQHLSDHRSGLHYPILFLIIGLSVTYLFGYWGYVFLGSVILHFINDFYGTGWGIPVLWPLTTRRYKFLGRRVNRLKNLLITDGDWERADTDEKRLKLVVSWSPEELPHYIKNWGEDDWINRWYLRLNWVSGIEYSLFILAIILVIITLLQ